MKGNGNKGKEDGDDQEFNRLKNVIFWNSSRKRQISNQYKQQEALATEKIPHSVVSTSWKSHLKKILHESHHDMLPTLANTLQYNGNMSKDTNYKCQNPWKVKPSQNVNQSKGNGQVNKLTWMVNG